MVDLPSDRFQEEPPFTHCGVDMFGPFHIKERRNTLNCYGVLFTCLVSRAVHIEMAKVIDTDSFILALRHFIARRGNVRSIRCDNGVTLWEQKGSWQNPLKKWIMEKSNISCSIEDRLDCLEEKPTHDKSHWWDMGKED